MQKTAVKAPAAAPTSDRPYLDMLFSYCEGLCEGKKFEPIQKWKALGSDHKVIGYFPVYTPVELIDAAGAFPMGVTGAGNSLELSYADTYFGSFICSIIKSTMELALRGQLDVLDGMLFHSICDSARNLASLFQRHFEPRFPVLYIHLPHNPSSRETVAFLKQEYERVARYLSAITGQALTHRKLQESIRLYNSVRHTIQSLYRFREENPHLLSTRELYALLKAGLVMSPQTYQAVLTDIGNELSRRERKKKDRLRVMLEGSFCENPPLELLSVLEEAGCYIVHDDLIPLWHWFREDIPEEGDPLEALAGSYVQRSRYASVCHDWRTPRPDQFLQKIKVSQAQAVVFCMAKFCEPALFDYVLFRKVAEENHIPYLTLEFEEKMWTFEGLRTNVETFVESLLFD